jgi:hypothetical protein
LPGGFVWRAFIQEGELRTVAMAREASADRGIALLAIPSLDLPLDHRQMAGVNPAPRQGTSSSSTLSSLGGDKVQALASLSHSKAHLSFCGPITSLRRQPYYNRSFCELKTAFTQHTVQLWKRARVDLLLPSEKLIYRVDYVQYN